MNRKVCKAFFVALSLIIMCLIFAFSSQEANTSQSVSNGFLNTLFSLIIPNFKRLSLAEKTTLLETFSTTTRKLAHFGIYSALGFSLNATCYNDYKLSRRLRPIFVLGFGLFYAAFDEVHQYFVPGRAMKFTDVFIDFCGVAFGAFILFVLYYLTKRGKSMNLNNIDIYELIKRDLGKIIYKSKKGIVAVTNEKDLVLTSLNDYNEFNAVLEKYNLSPDTITAKEDILYKEILKNNQVFRSLPCSQWVYTKLTPPQYNHSDIRMLDIQYLDVILKHYKLVSDKEYIIDRLNNKMIFGIFENDKIAGFIGIHSEGSIGMLEIFPEYRRKGYGYILEAYVIEQLLDKGFVPFCHVVDGNEASYKLQEKLGFKKSSKPNIWINIKAWVKTQASFYLYLLISTRLCSVLRCIFSIFSITSFSPFP